MTTLLVARNVSVSIRTSVQQVSVVRNVHLTLHAGKTLGLIGPSGSGKSMTAKALLHLLPKEATLSGSILFQGIELIDGPPKRWHNVRGLAISLMLQHSATILNPLRTVGQQIIESYRRRYPRSSFAAGWQWAADFLTLTNIHNAHRILSSYPHMLSGGQQQRVLIAMALAPAPQVLIIDEPTTALDAEGQAQVLHMLRSLQMQQHLGILFISHDLSAVATICDRVAVIHSGKIIEEGETDSVLSAPRHPYTQHLLCAQRFGRTRLVAKDSARS